MDGYALRSRDLDGPLRVVGTSAAGHPWSGEAVPGTAIRIFTGAPVPPGYDRVVMQENTVREGDSLSVATRSDATHIRLRGGDFAEGDVLPSGRKLTAADIGLLAAMNVPQVVVADQPRVAILAGGDELVRPGQMPQPGQIVSSNDLAIAALAAEGDLARLDWDGQTITRRSPALGSRAASPRSARATAGASSSRTSTAAPRTGASAAASGGTAPTKIAW